MDKKSFVRYPVWLTEREVMHILHINDHYGLLGDIISKVKSSAQAKGLDDPILKQIEARDQ